MCGCLYNVYGIVTGCLIVCVFVIVPGCLIVCVVIVPECLIVYVCDCVCG